MIKINTILILSIIYFFIGFKGDFLSDQKRYKRVRDAINEKQDYLIKKLEKEKITLGNLYIILVAYKADSLLEIYAKNRQDVTYKKILSYKICSISGNIGPKRSQGDRQVPEGFYYIDRFNPMSNFYLSLGLNYPNLSDKRKSKANNLGGDIFIHGSCVSIGCLAMTDDYIKEIYLLAVYARNNGQTNIPVYIFPFQMTDENFKVYKERYKDEKEIVDFWINLKNGYDNFIAKKNELNIKVDINGDYIYLKK